MSDLRKTRLLEAVYKILLVALVLLWIAYPQQRADDPAPAKSNVTGVQR